MSRQYTLPLPHREALTANDFIVSDSNREAVAWIDAWPGWPSPCLVLIGPSGSGKTHLAYVWLPKAQAVNIRLQNIRDQNLDQLVQKNPNLIIDNADKIAGNAGDEENLFHLYNLVREHKGSLMLVASLPPAQWNIVLPDLRSRLLASPVALIGAPDDALMSMMLVKQFHDRQITIGEDVIAYLMPRMERTTSALRRIVDSLDQASLAEKKNVTVALARRVLEANA
jgi:DnaA regulatory inactivator Hda